MARRSLNDIILKNWGMLNEAFRNIEDVIVEDNYNKVLQKLEPYRQEKQNRDRFLNIYNRLGSVDTSKIDPTKDAELEGIDTKGYAFANLNETQAWKTFTDSYKKKNPNYDGSSPIDIGEFQSYLKEYPQYNDELKQAGIIKMLPTKINKTEEEYMNDYYTQAGLTPAEVKWYNDYKQSMIPAATQNEKLSSFLTQYAPYLVSGGDLKDSRLKYLSNMAGTLALTDPKADDYDYREVGGQLVKINKRTNKVEIIPVKNSKTALKDYTANEIRKMTFEQVMSTFNSADIGKYLYDFSPEVRDKLFETFPDWKPEENTGGKKGGRGGRGGFNFGGLDEELNNTETAQDTGNTTGTDLGGRQKKALETVNKRFKNKSGSGEFSSQDIQRQRQEVATVLSEFKKRYDLLNNPNRTSVNPKAYLKFVSSIEQYYNDLLNNGYANLVLDEAANFMNKYLGTNIQ